MSEFQVHIYFVKALGSNNIELYHKYESAVVNAGLSFIDLIVIFSVVRILLI